VTESKYLFVGHQKKVFIKVFLNDTVIIYSIFLSEESMEFLEVSARLEFRSDDEGQPHSDCSFEQQIALSLIGEWAAEIDAMIKAEKKKPLEGGQSGRGGLQ
jgi:hypothetical protein